MPKAEVEQRLHREVMLLVSKVPS